MKMKSKRNGILTLRIRCLKLFGLTPHINRQVLKKHEDYGGCFSVENATGPVARFKKIHYHAYDINGNQIQGIAEGFLARVIQHEIDHLNGKVFLDYITPEKIMSKEEYIEMRKKAIEKETTNVKS